MTNANPAIRRSQTGSFTLLYLVLGLGIAMFPISDFLYTYAVRGLSEGQVGGRYWIYGRIAMTVVLSTVLVTSGRLRFADFRVFLW